MRAMKLRKLKKRLKELRCQFHRQGKGDHEVWINPANGQTAGVPVHPEVSPGVLRDIASNLGLGKEVFERNRSS